jgi:mRNA-degrading endonuclease RelE of RelBE toxin-antitoxin system
MNLKITKLETFAKEAKRLYKKYKKLPDDLKILVKELNYNPKAGIDLGANCYKIRLANSSIPTGKSSGFRVIYYYYDGELDIYLLTIFSKRDMDNISDEKIIELLKKYNLDL